MTPIPLLAQETIMNLDKFRFEQQAGRLESMVPLFLILLLLLLTIIPIVYFFMRYNARLEEATVQREDTRYRLLLTEWNLQEKELAVLQILSGSDNPADIVPILDSRGAFEEAVESFREKNPGHELLRKTPQLRQRFDFGFNNIRNPFVDTRMLAPGQKIRCLIRTAKREVEFVTTILATTEEQFIIRPPISKGQPVSLGHIPRLTFRVARENDAEYQFICPVRGELPNESRALRLEHTRTISRLLFRNAERVAVSVEAQFYVIRQDLIANTPTSQAKVSDAQNAINGVIKDLSIGGAMVLTREDGEALTEGQLVVFKLPQAQVKEDLTMVVVGQAALENGFWHIHLKFQGLKELNRLKISRFLATAKSPPKPAEAEPQPAAQ
ncbi:MAG: PilZ domain-containing protein [Deltaproteobacteria bacterium]|nr:PilZ domain-containing protein [Deltaproteobacteria bacterium]